jgi:hypothetical protein
MNPDVTVAQISFFMGLGDRMQVEWEWERERE